MRAWKGVGPLSVALACVMAAGAPSRPAGTVKLTTLDNLPLNGSGYYPQAPLIQGRDGALYGTTWFGGTNNCGTVYRLARTGALTTLYSFCSAADDGSNPSDGALAEGTDGNFYGATTYSGNSITSGPCASRGCGTLFKVTPTGTLTTLYNFCSQPNCTDGTIDYGGLVRGDDGNFYGASAGGGANTQCASNVLNITGCGAVFKITAGGAYSVLYSFCSQANCADGSAPFTGLTSGADGQLYGITTTGGANGTGTIFKLSLSGVLTTLHSFGGSDGTCGAGSCAPMIQSRDGNFYGTTPVGGTSNCGTFFRMTQAGVLATLYTFSGFDGCSPFGLVEANDGNFYGPTTGGGSNECTYGACGTLFEMTAAGVLTTLINMDGNNGYEPDSLVQATTGLFYGATFYGGTSNNGGTVFSLSAGLRPFVQLLPTAGKVNANIEILGTNLGNATGVSFNGVPAVFTVKSNTLLTARVPGGATSGFVTVAGTGKALRSSVRFSVQP